MNEHMKNINEYFKLVNNRGRSVHCDDCYSLFRFVLNVNNWLNTKLGGGVAVGISFLSCAVAETWRGVVYTPMTACVLRKSIGQHEVKCSHDPTSKTLLVLQVVPYFIRLLDLCNA